ncbi:MAG: hypothetical protein LBT05_02515 [Planctomycetaceae bacterium]|jgi:uncharacterized short protein YbdD (DUF466 family)|nr:hypothetical protein [Planctomycetaceae bacterium]
MTDTEQFFQLIQKKRERLICIRELSQRQLQYVGEENLGALLELLAAKQRLLIEIEGVDKHLAKYREDDPEKRVWSSPEMRQQCRETAAQCDILIRKILEIDGLAGRQLTEKKEAAGRSLKQLDNSARVQNAYRQQKKSPNFLQNTKMQYKIDLNAR